MTLTEMQPNLLVAGLNFPEGPAFDEEGNLWAVELKGGGLVRWRDGTLRRIATGGAPNGIAIDRQGRINFCDAEQCSIRRYDPVLETCETIASEVDGMPLFRPNDLAFDPRRTLIFTNPGDSRQEPTGYVCALTAVGAVRKIATHFHFCNGLAFTPDGRELIVAETYRQRLWRGEWDADRVCWIKPRIWAEGLLGVPGPDGMAFAGDGTLFVAVYGSGRIMRVDEDGTIVEHLTTPGNNPTNCAFDPSGRLGLVVTEAERGEILSLPLSLSGARLQN